MADDDEEVLVNNPKTHEAEPLRRRPKRINIPRRDPSVVTPGRQVIYITADKTTCKECPCFPKEEPYQKPKKLNACQVSPLSLYELAASVVDALQFPRAFSWAEEKVASWMEETCCLPEYKDCMLENHIDGMRLLMLEDPSKLPPVNIHVFEHIMIITENVRKLFSMDFIRFARSVGLPPRYPLPHCTWFKSRTGPSWGIRRNWTRCDLMRWMKIIQPAPVYRDHWELVWYQKPDFPRVLFARIGKRELPSVPHYIPPTPEVCREYQVRRKFRIQTGIPEESQLIWMEHRPDSPTFQEMTKPKVVKKRVRIVAKDTTLYPKRVSLTGLKGKDLILARRKMFKPKFLP